MAKPPGPQLIVNADDFGLSPPVNEGILRAHREGIVTAASLMAVGMAFDHAVGLARQAPGLDIGVHLTLVEERPLLSQRSSLADGRGRFPPGALALVRALATGKIRHADVRAEWAAQIEKILAAGLTLSHLDSHQHVHALPGLSAIATELAAAYRIAVVRAPLERPRRDMFARLTAVPRLVGWLTLCAAWITARSLGQTPVHAPRFLGFCHGGRLDAGRLGLLLVSLKPGRVYELMCHPGYRPEQAAYGRWGYGHETELAALTAPQVKTLITRLGIQLRGFADGFGQGPGCGSAPTAI